MQKPLRTVNIMDSAIQLDAIAVYPLVHNVLKNWHKSDQAVYEPFRNWLLMRHGQQKLDQPNGLLLPEVVKQQIKGALEDVSSIAYGEAHLLRQRFIHNKTIRRVALDLEKSVDQTNRVQRTALERLASVLANKEDALRKKHISEQEGHLPSCLPPLPFFSPLLA